MQVNCQVTIKTLCLLHAVDSKVPGNAATSRKTCLCSTVQVSKYSSRLPLRSSDRECRGEHQSSILPVWRDSERSFTDGEQQHGQSHSDDPQGGRAGSAASAGAQATHSSTTATRDDYCRRVWDCPHLLVGCLSGELKHLLCLPLRHACEGDCCRHYHRLTLDSGAAARACHNGDGQSIDGAVKYD